MAINCSGSFFAISILDTHHVPFVDIIAFLTIVVLSGNESAFHPDCLHSHSAAYDSKTIETHVHSFMHQSCWDSSWKSVGWLFVQTKLLDTTFPATFRLFIVFVFLAVFHTNLLATLDRFLNS
jgi:hypothetical protein